MHDYPHTITEKAPQTSTNLSFDLNAAPAEEEGHRSPHDMDTNLCLNYGTTEGLIDRDTGRGYNHPSFPPNMNHALVFQNPANPIMQLSYSNLTRSHIQPHPTTQPHSQSSHPYPSSGQTPGQFTLYVGTPSTLD